MRSRSGIEIETVGPGSPAEKAGLRPGDLLVSVNTDPISDVIDFMFHKSADRIDTVFYRSGIRHAAHIVLKEDHDLGITVKPFKVKTCRNNCIFCFVKQLPKGLRKSLYIKDEDYRLSFLYGNYMTLSNIDSGEKKRIVEQRLSPLYVSVHSTNRNVRNTLLGNPLASDIMKELGFFAENKIRIHTQIVLCPGYNDGRELQSTIRDLYKFFPYVSSIAVVPVGLTLHRKQQLRPVAKDDALAALDIVETFRKRFMKKHGDPLVFCSDEMYIKAEIPFPPLKEYGVLPQIENGVGMVPLFLSQAKKIKLPPGALQGRRFLTFTGISFYPFLKKFTDRLRERENVMITALPVENSFFGRSVTVAGLLTGHDVIRTLTDQRDSYDTILVPDVALKEDADLFLDDVSLHDIEKATGLKTVRAEASPQGLVDAMGSEGSGN